MGEEKKVFTLAEVAEHDSPKDCWLIVHGKVRFRFPVLFRYDRCWIWSLLCFPISYLRDVRLILESPYGGFMERIYNQLIDLVLEKDWKPEM